MSAVPPSWAPYIPDENLPWTRRRAVHLHRRAAFGAAAETIDRDLADGPQKAVDRLLAGDAEAGSAFDQTAALIGSAAVDSGSADRLKAWWLYRCLFSPRPLVERMTLLWHNHFATSNLKVNDLKLMRGQNETLRRHVLGPFGTLLTEMLRDPALLEWLDASSNRKGKPNENLGRELLELFTLGVGHYTEQDVRETARALTGCSVRQGVYSERPAAHDDEEKTCFGQTGRWSGGDILRMLIGNPALSRRMAWRLTSEFFGEEVIGPAAIDELAAGLRGHDLDIGWGVSTILRSRLFFSDANIGTRVCDPATFLLSPLRSLELTREPPSTLVLAEWLARMGQDLFYPPNVGGWPGGRAWLSTRTIVARANFVASLAEGKLTAASAPPDLPRLFGLPTETQDGKLIPEITRRLFGSDAPEGVSSRGPNNEARTPSASALLTVLTSPEAHRN